MERRIREGFGRGSNTGRDHGGNFGGGKAGKHGAFGNDFGGGGGHDTVFDAGGGFVFAEMTQEHGGGTDGGDGVGLVGGGFVKFGAGAHRTEHAGFAGVDAADGGIADPALADGSDVCEDVAEEIAGDDDIELFRVADHLHGDIVDPEVVAYDVGELAVSHFGEGPHPERVHVGEEAAFAAEGDAAAPIASTGEFEGEAEAAVDLLSAVHHGFLGDFEIGSGEHGTADTAIDAGGIFADDTVVDMLGTFVAEVAFDAWRKTNGAQGDILIEVAGDFEQDFAGEEAGFGFFVMNAAEKDADIR